jgi:peptidoglycan hydrolase-like protein with peptidoglycan-binding domain
MTKQNDAQVQDLKVQVTDLQAKLQQKDAEIDGLRQALSRVTEEKFKAVQVMQTENTKPTGMQIQTALKNAGFDPGAMDGRPGRKTTKAVRDFQAANKLSIDGKVGKQTWSVLSKYLNAAPETSGK